LESYLAAITLKKLDIEVTVMGEIRTEMDTEIMTVTTTTEDVNVVAFSIPRLSKRDYVK